MARTRPTALGSVLAVALAVSACTSSPTGSASTPSRSVAERSSAAPPSASPSAANPTSVEVTSPSGGSVLVRGAYPREKSPCKHHEQPVLRARYPGTLSIERAKDGTLSIMVTLPFERYLDGIAEMPASWPMAALEAQAVAARSYALATTGWSGKQGSTLRTPICATTSCQVYAGLPIGRSPGIRRWYRAVRRTSGQVLLYGGRPAETLYFSTSNGQTYGNQDVFGSAPLPYLQPVVERDDGASPLSHWSARLPFADLARFLKAAGDWPAGAAISGVRLVGGSVAISGGSASRSLDMGTFRDDVNTWASCLEPGRYPPGGLPTTIPSSWLSMSTLGGAVTITGRGWGHGVGMVQWGAYGKARRGWSASQILAFYYGGLRPERYPQPGLIHVQVASGLKALRIAPSGPGALVNGRAVGTGPIVIGGGQALTVRTP